MAVSKSWKIDLNKISIGEYRSLFDEKQPRDMEDAIIAKCAGLSVDELLALPQPEFRQLCAELLRRAREPLADPNLPSGSTAITS